METGITTGWLIEPPYFQGHGSTGLSIRTACCADTGTSVSVWFDVHGVCPPYLGGHLTANYGCSSRAGASMDFKAGDIVRVDVEREPYPNELGIIISVYPGFAWANYVRFPFANKEMLISTAWLSKVGEITE